MKLLITILILMSTSACGDSVNARTWGDASYDISTSYCGRLLECGFYEEEDYDICFDHNYYHMCELRNTCEIVSTEEFYNIADQCAEALEGWGCSFLSWGLLPKQCEGLL